MTCLRDVKPRVCRRQTHTHTHTSLSLISGGGVRAAAKWLHYNPLLLVLCGLEAVLPPHVRLTRSHAVMSIRPDPSSALVYKPRRVMLPVYWLNTFYLKSFGDHPGIIIEILPDTQCRVCVCVCLSFVDVIMRMRPENVDGEAL
jgi:hypothetical protein